MTFNNLDENLFVKNTWRHLSFRTKKLFLICEPGDPLGRLYRVRVRARVNGDVAQMVSALAQACLVERSRVRVPASSKYFSGLDSIG